MYPGPALVQIAHKRSPRLLVPAALFYDHPGFDPDSKTDPEDFALCKEFSAALGQPKPLEETLCFQGRCPSVDEPSTVCPSGFWGFRHFLGMPIDSGTDATLELAHTPPLQAFVSVSMDPGFVLRERHERRLEGLLAIEDPISRSPDDTLRRLDGIESVIVYFYCHGGIRDDVPFLRVGPPDGKRITSAVLVDRVQWTERHPLVFINGCKTTGVSPEVAFEFVSAFVRGANAAGVIGSQITIFEPLACAFAEEFFRRFAKEGLPIGEAGRSARLALLKKGNPLGLVYDLFVLPTVRLVPKSKPVDRGRSSGEAQSGSESVPQVRHG
jgi:hypothetical protein